MATLNCKKVMLMVDPVVATLPTADVVRCSLRNANVNFVEFDDIRCEPTDGSVLEAVEFARSQECDGFIAFGGGSTMGGNASPRQ